MKIVTISDTHNKHKKIEIPDGDIIIHAGDVSGRGHLKEVGAFLNWYGDLPHKYKVLVAGNHDFGFENKNRFILERMCQERGIFYLNDRGIYIEGINIWGSPVQPEFCNWAFNRSRTVEDANTENAKNKGHTYIGLHWDLISSKADIVVTHGPAHGILDQVKMLGSPNRGDHVGCKALRKKLEEIKPKLHISGHIHEGRGVQINGETTYVNASVLDERYQPYPYRPFVFDWEKVKKGESSGCDY